jgi:hypothetical protein
MSGWIVVGLLVFLGPQVLRRLNAYLARLRLRKLGLVAASFTPVDEATVPEGVRAGLVPAGLELGALGFVPGGYLQSVDGLAPDSPRHWAVFVHPAEGTVATLAFQMQAKPVGVTADFVTLFEDGWWVGKAMPSSATSRAGGSATRWSRRWRSSGRPTATP